jgi:hypothetical protein
MKGGRDCMWGDGDGRPGEGKRMAEGGCRGHEREHEAARRWGRAPWGGEADGGGGLQGTRAGAGGGEESPAKTTSPPPYDAPTSFQKFFYSDGGGRKGTFDRSKATPWSGTPLTRGKKPYFSPLFLLWYEGSFHFFFPALSIWWERKIQS